MAAFIKPESIAEATLFLASSGSNSTTGVVLNVDGGQIL
jgi:NAD(P)-dependent dehydrogenase (short-subunit alcohol dehydrogenase family)